MGSSRLPGGVLLFACTLFTLFGCGQADRAGPAKPDKNDEKKQEVTEKKVHDHSGWWCDEHGIPEAECSMCLPPSKVKTMFKDKGDWCKLHDRADSQCFLCHPELEAKFAARYEAKMGKKPPIPEENRAKPEDKKGGKG